jgi:hypothetical protein
VTEPIGLRGRENVAPERAASPRDRARLGAGCALLGVAMLLVAAAVLFVAFGQPPAGLLAIVAVPLAWAGVRSLTAARTRPVPSATTRRADGAQS